jgi:hypothetical protein
LVIISIFIYYFHGVKRKKCRQAKIDQLFQTGKGLGYYNFKAKGKIQQKFHPTKHPPKIVKLNPQRLVLPIIQETVFVNRNV